MKPRAVVPTVVASLCTTPVLADTPVTPDAGQQARSIKTLPDDDIAAARVRPG